MYWLIISSKDDGGKTLSKRLMKADWSAHEDMDSVQEAVRKHRMSVGFGGEYHVIHLLEDGRVEHFVREDGQFYGVLLNAYMEEKE